ncbi:MAG: ribosome maturation factor RimM [Gammaproteobacteria bacterium]
MNKQEQDEYVVVGQLGTAHGIKGWSKVASFTSPRGNLLDYSPWYLKQGDVWQERKVLSSRVQGKGMVVQLDNVQNRDEALALRGTEVAIHRSQLPSLESDEYYWADLVGLNVVTIDNVPLGKVTEMLATGSNDVLIIDDNERQRLVPFIQGQVVKKVDLDNAVLSVDWDPDF